MNDSLGHLNGIPNVAVDISGNASVCSSPDKPTD